MRRNKVTLTLICLALSVAVWGCETTTTNTNGNSNTAVVTNTNTSVANANTNVNRPVNANVSREEYEKDKNYYEQEAKRLGRKIGSGANDLWLWTKTRSALAYADDLKDVTINVDVENDVVTLTGTVPTDKQKARAEQVAKSIEGVKSVKNDLTVSNTK